MFQDMDGHLQDLKIKNIMDGRPTYDLHWKPLNYKTWDGIFYAYDLDGQ